MIQKSVLISMRKMASCIGHRYFSTGSTVTIDQIRNSNLKFDTDNWTLQVYPFYPQIFKKKEKNLYQISSLSPVLSMVFVDKNVEDSIAWQNRKSISFKFKDIGTMLSLQMKSGKQISIETIHNYKTNSTRSKFLALKDLPHQQQISFNLTSKSEGNRSSSLNQLQGSQIDWQVSAKMPYHQYRILYKIIQNSLLDLSGWRLMMQVQKKQQLSKMDSKALDDKEAAQLLKN